MGYYLDFNVDPETGRPTGCPSFDKFNGIKRSNIVDCEKQMYAPEGEPLNEIVEDFADNQDNWIKDFYLHLKRCQTMDMMLLNSHLVQSCGMELSAKSKESK